MRKILATLALLLAGSAVQGQPQYCYGINPLNNAYYRYDTTAQTTRSLGTIGQGNAIWATGRYVYAGTYRVGTSANSVVMDNKGTLWVVTPVNVNSPILLGTTGIVSTWKATPMALASASDGSGGTAYYCVAYDSTSTQSLLFSLNLSTAAETYIGAVSLNGSTTGVLVTQLAGNLDAAGAAQFWAIDSGNNWYKLDGSNVSGPALSLVSSGTCDASGIDYYPVTGGGNVLGMHCFSNPPYVSTVSKTTGACTALFQASNQATIITVTK